jgi:hypothetical protein
VEYPSGPSYCLRGTKDIPVIDFGDSLETKINSLNTLRSEISKVKNGLNDNIQSEFDSFKFYSILNNSDSTKCFQPIQLAINDPINSKEFKAILQSFQSIFKNYLSEANSVFQILGKDLAESKDIKLNCNFDDSFQVNKMVLAEVKEKIELIKAEFDTKVQIEFQQISLLNANPNEVEIKSLPILQEKVNALAEKMQGDNWTFEKVKFTEFYKFITDVETLISNKTEYFNAERDLFTIEFKWFQFYNSLSDTNKKIVNELKIKSNWRKSFLVFYLNSMLINSANLDLL